MDPEIEFGIMTARRFRRPAVPPNSSGPPAKALMQRHEHTNGLPMPAWTEMHVFGCEPRQQPPHDANVELGFQVQAQVSRRQHVNRWPAAQPCSLAHGGHTNDSTVTDVERRLCSTCAYVKYVIGTSTARCDHAMQAVRLNTMHDCC